MSVNVKVNEFGGRFEVKGGIPPPALNLPPTTPSPKEGFTGLWHKSAYLDMLMIVI